MFKNAYFKFIDFLSGGCFSKALRRADNLEWQIKGIDKTEINRLQNKISSLSWQLHKAREFWSYLEKDFCDDELFEMQQEFFLFESAEDLYRIISYYRMILSKLSDNHRKITNLIKQRGYDLSDEAYAVVRQQCEEALERSFVPFHFDNSLYRWQVSDEEQIRPDFIEEDYLEQLESAFSDESLNAACRV